MRQTIPELSRQIISVRQATPGSLSQSNVCETGNPCASHNFEVDAPTCTRQEISVRQAIPELRHQIIPVRQATPGLIRQAIYVKQATPVPHSILDSHRQAILGH